MVSSTGPENVKSSSPQTTSKAVGVPPGDYRLVGWGMDATGRKLIDEICQIAGYTPSSTYAQYVMPFKDLNPTARKRHNIKVANTGKFRVLKDSKTNKMLKTKSEVSALTDFLTWLESVKGDAVDGIILVYHEPRKVIPAMLCESLKKYNLLDKFNQIVKGFANGFNIAEAKCTGTVNTFSLRTLSRVLLDKDEQLCNAVDRARLALQIVQHLSDGEEVTKGIEASGRGDSDATAKGTIELIREFVQPTHVEIEELAELKLVLQRQNGLQPIFGPLLRVRRDRQYASPLRRLLAEAGIDYKLLQEAWTNQKKEGLEKLIIEKVIAATPKDVQDLLDLLECHFDPEKIPKFRAEQEKRDVKKGSPKSTETKDNSKTDSSETESPDTTTAGSPLKEKIESENVKAEIAAN
ncbi:maternal protein exuperantia [Orussus abietinus]|uniref:maternal protein exuperantia n=1 Tax=Orussus abietinus TaxID=222816 RepID=UPI000625BD45|nr:maternal protein exuperantia [Orussus abietinus]XP_012273306.1 maternal protein exuperantia [Orussus abietinus]